MSIEQRMAFCAPACRRLRAGRQPGQPAMPAAIAALAAAAEPVHAECNVRASAAGRRYRGAFWSLYLLSSLAVVCAVLPLALGWDRPGHRLHAWARLWPVLEVLLIGTLGAVYWLGHQQDWQGQWLASRTEAELARYLPLLAALVVPGGPEAAPNWYARLPGHPASLGTGGAIEALCAGLQPGAERTLGAAWQAPQFVAAYAAWAAALLEQQCGYHRSLARRSVRLMHAVHTLNAWLFGLTLAGALAHLALHSPWLTVLTVSFPALGAALHGALAQSEAYRIAATSSRLAADLQGVLPGIRACTAPDDAAALRAALAAALVLILEEHRDWHMLVRPHHLPLG